MNVLYQDPNVTRTTLTNYNALAVDLYWNETCHYRGAATQRARCNLSGRTLMWDNPGQRSSLHCLLS
jgi:hypothetical protein